jgi:hypothetical protein
MIAACMYMGMPTLAICIAAVMHHADESDLDEVSLVQRTYGVPDCIVDRTERSRENVLAQFDIPG